RGDEDVGVGDVGAGMRGERDNVRRGAHAIMLAAMAATLAGNASDPAHAQKLDARYVISMTGIRVGQSTWTVTMEEDRYSAAASGGSVDILSVLVRGEGAAQVSGGIKDARLIP